MHMADALISPAVAATMYGGSAIAAGFSIKKLHDENDTKKIPLMGIMGAFVFATQMINFTIPGTGSSGHLCGGMLLSALLGPYAGFLTMICILLIQGLFFADGGLLALGCNVWNMAFYGCFAGSLLVWLPMMKKSCNTAKIFASSIIGCVLTLQLGAFSVVLETFLSGISELPFNAFVAMIQPIHLAIGTVEGLITASILSFIFAARPDYLWGIQQTATSKEGKLSVRATLAVLACCTLVIGGGLSLAASSNPDGLEWALEKVAGTSELEATGKAYAGAQKIQDTTAFLPDYTFKSSESTAGTSVSGIAGAAVVFSILFAIGVAVKLVRRKQAVPTKK